MSPDTAVAEAPPEASLQETFVGETHMNEILALPPSSMPAEVVGALPSLSRVDGLALWLPVSLAMFVTAWGGNEFTPLLVMYREAGSLSAVAVDTLLFTYVLGLVPALLVGGPLSDRFGRRPLMLPAPAIAALGSLLLAAGPDSLAMLSAGRILSGFALGLSMAVGGSWLAELARRQGLRSAIGARRAAMSLTAGFGIGAGLAGVLAQWGPAPEITPYAINIALAVMATAWLFTTAETHRQSRPVTALIDDLKIRGLGDRRFLFIVLPIAPWVFGAGASAYAITPTLMTDHVGVPIAFAGLCAVLGLAAGFAIQSVGRRIDDPSSVRGPASGLIVVAVGMLIAALAASTLNVAIALLGVLVLGCGYGMCLIIGLLEVTRLAGPGNLAGLTAVFYTVTYLGFAVPAILSTIAQRWPAVTYSMMFGFGALAAMLCLAIVALAHRSERRVAAS